MLPRKLQRLLFAVAAPALATTALTVIGIEPVLAEFEIQEAEIERGEVELEYRGAYHWGLPRAGGIGTLGALDEQEEGEVPLRQSHDFEMEMGITDRWMLSTTLGTVVPAGENWQAESVELETQLELIERQGNGLGLAFIVGYGWATQAEVANEVEFGPIVELASGSLLLTLNPFFTNQVGEFAETEGLGFEYGWRAEYDPSKKWGLGVEMFGEIEDLANAGSFNSQVHSIGPTLFLNFGGDEEGDGPKDEVETSIDEVTRPPATALSMNVGVQFGLTDMTSDAALKFQGSLAF